MKKLFKILTSERVEYDKKSIKIFDMLRYSSHISNILESDKNNYIKNMCLFLGKKISNNTIFFIDDEKFEQQYEKLEVFFEFIKRIDAKNKNIIYIVKTQIFADYFEKYGIKNYIFEPLLEVINFYYGSFRIRKSLVGDKIKDVSFCSLNGTKNQVREFLLYRLNDYNLLPEGYVTACGQFFLDLNGEVKNHIFEDKFFDKFYYDEGHKYYQDKNLVNILYIDKNIPGNIFLTVESFNYDKIEESLRPLYTEKTSTPFLTKRLPLIIGYMNIIENLKMDGFDMFDDIIDYEYDKIDHMDYQKKVDLCIKNNSHILKHNNFYDNPEIDERLEYNKKHYNVWVENKILNFESNIEEKLKLFV